MNTTHNTENKRLVTAVGVAAYWRPSHCLPADAEPAPPHSGVDVRGLVMPALGDAAIAATADAGVWELEGLPSGSAGLVVKRGRNAGARFQLDQTVTAAGRHPDSHVLLDDITVSRRHAEFRREHREFRIIDMGSLNGTYVNREPVDSIVLANGDEIQIGKFRLVFFTKPTTD